MPKTRIDARDAVDDIRAGLDDASLMKKYKVSAKGLQSLVKKLVHAGILQQSEVQDRIGEPEGSVIIDYSTMSFEDFATETVGPLEETENARVLIGLAISEDPGLKEILISPRKTNDLRIHLCDQEPITTDLLARYAPNFIILDVNLTRMHFLEVIRTANQCDECVPVILVADAAHRHEAAQGVREGAYGVMEQPLDPLLLESLAARCVTYADLARFKRDHEKIMETAIKDQTREIVKTKDFLKGILDSSTLVSVVLTDLEQSVRYWNKGAENIFGYSAEEMIGHKITKIYPPDSLTKDSVQELRGTMEDQGGTVHTKMRQVAKDGRMLTVALALTPMRDEQGAFTGILGMGLDVTEEVRQNKEILKLLQKVKKTQDAAILALAKLTEARDGQSGSHLSRVQEYCRALCASLAKSEAHKEIMTQKYVDDLVRSSVLHDVGKVLLPDSVLLFEGEYGPNEREIMRQHPLIGGRALQDAVKKIGSDSFLNTGMEVAFYHHEHWDGSGYPFGLSAEEIPFSARIVALADTYDALTTERTYRKAYTHEQACAIIMEGKGTHFDPRVVEAFEELQSEFQMIKHVFGD